jgi:hypothetical protein
MDEVPHRNYQNLPKIGPTYSSKDEKQRIIVEEIKNYRIRPELKLRINMNIPGLDKKKKISPINVSTYRLIARASSKGREGWYYLWTMPNITRFIYPMFLYAAYFYYGYSSVYPNYYEKYKLNQEFETAYTKFQQVNPPYCDKWSMMS